MNKKLFTKALLPLAVTTLLGTSNAFAGILVQCPGDTNEDAYLTNSERSSLVGEPGWDQNRVDNLKCMHLGSSDGFATMGDGSTSYIFGFSDMTRIPTNSQRRKERAFDAATLAAQWPAPTIELDEGNELFLTLTNVGMMMRPDLFDPHSVHVHGFPEASYVFDGIPDVSLSINMNASMSYYYKFNDPGTYMYHCHVEAAEHMQMGMLGNLYVNPQQDGQSIEYPIGSGKFYSQFAYNDGDGSTGYDVDYPIQLGSFDSAFHTASETVQPLPFALMKDDYPMINGRGYPDTVDPRTQNRNPDNTNTFPPTPGSGAEFTNTGRNLKTTQPVSSLVTATAGDRVLLRITNLNITRFYTLQSLGLPMQVVGKDAKLLRSSDGTSNLYYGTNSVTLGGGESYDVIVDTTGTNPGDVFFLYASNLNYLSNGEEVSAGMGGMLTEIHIN